MPISRAKSIDQLYEECRDFDLVIVPDAPLADAINRRLDRPHFGAFAITPRRLAAQRREGAEDRPAFIETIAQTDLDWKEAAYIVGNILQCWEYQGTIDALLEYDGYGGAATETVIGTLRDSDTTSRRLTDFTVDASQDVAVVGVERLTPLEQSILPAEYTSIDHFTAASFDHPPFRIFESSAAIVDTVLDAITAETAEEFAIVIDQTSAYSALVESALEAADIPFYGGPGFIDDPDNRGLLRLLRTAYTGQDVRVADVKPILTQLGQPLPVKHDDKRLVDLTHPAAEALLTLRERATSGTLAEAIGAYETATDTHLELFREELDRLGVLSDPVTERLVDRLHFYVQTYEVPLDRENEGVLLADAKAAAHVDRPVVFYLGLDEGWTHQAPRRPWVDQDAEYTRNIQQFQLLLQNGVEQHFLVEDAAGGQPITPCLYFEELLDDAFERFSDLDSIAHGWNGRDTENGFRREPLGVGVDHVTTISQSSLNTYANCPRDYFFDRLVETPDAEHLEEGDLFHDFAEFYAAHPEAVDGEALTTVVDCFIDEMAPFLRDTDRDVKRTEYRAALETITAFFDANPPTDETVVTPTERRGENRVAEHFDRPIDSPIAEQWFEADDIGIKGKIDLIHAPTRLLDYKSGTKSTASKILQDAAIDPPSDTPNFQALLYLTYWRTVQPDDPLEFTFFYFTETVDDVVRGEADIEDCLTTIAYRPVTFEEHIQRESVFDELQQDAAKNCQKTFSKVEYDDYRAIVAAHEIPATRESDTLIQSSFGQALIDQMQNLVGTYKYVTSGCKQALRHLTRIRSEAFFAEDVDAFEAFVAERLKELNDRRGGTERFPVQGLAGDPNTRRLAHRDLILEGDSDA